MSLLLMSILMISLLMMSLSLLMMCLRLLALLLNPSLPLIAARKRRAGLRHLGTIDELHRSQKAEDKGDD
ncbi:hypothetical protein GQ53DRAFT_753687 [Thozetella sp. PMI_491]|nr:hypothetical protein GQ53DRAFT_753687 [Thozetella sp. PMI_491]